MSHEKGFSHVLILTGVLAVALVGTLGFVFWQNFSTKNSDTSSRAASNNESSASEAAPSGQSEVTSDIGTPDENVDYVDVTKNGIHMTMKNQKFIGIEEYTMDKMDGAIAYSEAIIFDGSANEVINMIYNNVTSNARYDQIIWDYGQFEDLSNARLNQVNSDTKMFKLDGTYVALGRLSKDRSYDRFISYKINSDAKITQMYGGLL